MVYENAFERNKASSAQNVCASHKKQRNCAMFMQQCNKQGMKKGANKIDIHIQKHKLIFVYIKTCVRPSARAEFSEREAKKERKRAKCASARI